VMPTAPAARRSDETMERVRMTISFLTFR